MTEEQAKYRVIASAHLRSLKPPTTAEEADRYCRQATDIDVPSDTVAWLTMSDIIYDVVWCKCVDFGLDPQEYRIK